MVAFPWSSPAQLSSGDPWRGCTRGSRRRMPVRASCDVRGRVHGDRGFVDEAYLWYYESEPRKEMEAAVRDLTKLQAIMLLRHDLLKWVVSNPDGLRQADE